MPHPTGQQPPARKPAALISFNDAAFAAALPVLCAIAWVTPDRAHHKLARLFSDAVARINPGKATREQKSYAATFGISDHEGFRREVRGITFYEILSLLALRRPGSRVPPVSLVGHEHLERALAAGKGVILWVTPTTFGPMMTKLALHQSEHPMWHLSRPSHGFSGTRFAQTFLNPVRTRFEDRFLAGRITIRKGNVGAALAEMAECLRLNGVVSITIGTEAKTVSTVPFLAGTMTVADRPPVLAAETGATLLPAVSIKKADGSFETEIGPPLQLPGALDQLARFLEPKARAYPAQFAKAWVFWRKAATPSP